MAAHIDKPIEQDVIDLAREGLAIRVRRTQQRKWRLELAKQRLEELEQLNKRALEKLGNPSGLTPRQEFEIARRHLMDDHRRAMNELAQQFSSLR